jgi:predicted ABC-type ATPase
VPQVIIIAGPNGAGKTTFARNYLTGPREHFTYVNADEIARATGGDAANIKAARTMLERIDNLVRARSDFAFETTLATLSYSRKITAWHGSGFVATLIYLRLPSVEKSLERVRRRVLAGGHDIPEDAIRRRFNKSSTYFENLYKSIVDRWYIFDSTDGAFVQAASWDGK